MVLARTLKGKGLSAIEGKDGWHGKALKKGKETDDAIAELEKQFVPNAPRTVIQQPPISNRPAERVDYAKLPKPAYKLGDLVATREAWGAALAAVGTVDERIVALDADVKNSTFSDKFEKAAPRSLLRRLHRRAGDGWSGHGTWRRAAPSRSRRRSPAS